MVCWSFPVLGEENFLPQPFKMTYSQLWNFMRVYRRPESTSPPVPCPLTPDTVLSLHRLSRCCQMVEEEIRSMLWGAHRHWGHVPRYELANLQQGHHFVFKQLLDLRAVFNLNISFFGEFLDGIENSDPCFLDRSHSYWKITIWWVKKIRKKKPSCKT